MTKTKGAELMLIEGNNNKEELVDAKDSFVYHKVVTRKDRQNYVFLKVNQPFKELFNLAKTEIEGKKIVDIIDENKLSFDWRKLYNRVLAQGQQLKFTSCITKSNSWYEVVIYKLSADKLLTSFSNIDKRRINYQHAKLKESFDNKILDSLKDQIVVINQAGVIEYTNQVWKDFARKNNIDPQEVSEGNNYLASIDENENNSAKKIFNQLEAIINGEIDSFQQKYSCHSPNKKSWFKMYAKKNQFFKQIKIVIVHEEITKRELSRQKIRKQARLRRLINRLSTLFINLAPSEIDPAINGALKDMVEFIEAERCYIFLFDLKNTVANRIYSWHNEDVDSLDNRLKNKLKNANTKNYPWLMEELNDSMRIRISDLEQLPTEADNFKQVLIKANVKSFLAVPIIYNNNLLGLIAFDTVTEKSNWSQEAIALLKITGELFAAVIKRKETEQRLTDYTAEVEEANMELEYISTKLQERISKAQKLHQQFLPSDLPEIGDLELAAYYQPAENLGGDFYNVIKYQNQLLFYIVDITGHGLDGAMLNIFIRESINSFLFARRKDIDSLSPKKIIEFIYQRYCEEDFPDDYFICTILGVIDLDTLEVRLSNAGIQVPVLITDQQGNITALNSDAPPISSVIEAEFFAAENLTGNKFSLSSGDNLLLATDGLIEEEVNQELYGIKRLKEVLSRNYSLPAEIKLEAIKQDFVNFADDLVSKDDITLFTLGKKVTNKDSFSKEITSNLEQGYKLLDEVSIFISDYYDDVLLIQMGLQEMIINAIEHGNQLDESKTVELKIEIRKDYFIIIIKDQGSGFDWYQKSLLEFNIEEELEDPNTRGRGIKIANKVFDSMYYNQEGNQVYLIKFI